MFGKGLTCTHHNNDCGKGLCFVHYTKNCLGQLSLHTIVRNECLHLTNAIPLRHSLLKQIDRMLAVLLAITQLLDIKLGFDSTNCIKLIFLSMTQNRKYQCKIIINLHMLEIKLEMMRLRNSPNDWRNSINNYKVRPVSC